ncbi:MAG: hypothetical protein ACLQVJ_10360 [Syntrophobacteraceae bacterium]
MGGKFQGVPPGAVKKRSGTGKDLREIEVDREEGKFGRESEKKRRQYSHSLFPK